MARQPRIYAEVRLRLKLAGTPLPEYDLWIADACLRHQLTLLTLDRHFDGSMVFPRLPRELFLAGAKPSPSRRIHPADTIFTVEADLTGDFCVSPEDRLDGRQSQYVRKTGLTQR